jgi:hypothetical protein
MRVDIPIKPDMAGELSAGTKISRTKLVAADVSGTEAAFKGERKPSAAQFEGRTQGADESVFPVLAKPTGGKIKPSLQMPIRAHVPAPKIVVEECFGLSEMLAGVFGWKSKASADGLEPEFLLFLLRLRDKWQRASENRYLY